MGLRIGWLSTGRDEAARNLLRTVYDDIKRTGSPAEIDWIFCHRELGDGPDNEEARQRKMFLELAEQLGIPVKTRSHVRFMPELRKNGLAESLSAADASPDLERWRDLFGSEVVRVVSEEPADICVMAGYMLIIGRPELDALNLVNIHPALPWGPRGTWQECIHRLIEERSQEQGIMIHLVTKVLDRGPVISYCRFPIRGPEWDHLWSRWDTDISLDAPREVRERHPLFRRIREVGEVRELPLLSGAIMEIARGNIEIRDRLVFASGRLRLEGVDLTDQIEAIISGSST
ncbi:MAG: formyltransferase family protein [Pseudomonadota bacterium]